MKLGHSDHKNLMFIYNLLQSSEHVDLSILHHLRLDEYLELIDIHWINKSYAAANHILDLGLSKFPSNIDLIDKKIQNLIYENEYKSAYHFLKNYAIEFLKPFDLKIIEIDLFLKMNLYDKVQLMLQNIRPLSDEQESTVLYYSGILALKTANLFRAEELFKQSILFWPENQSAQTQISKLYLKEQKLEDNEPFIDEVLDLNPFSFQFWYCKGKIHSSRGDYQAALEAYDFAHVSCEQYLPAIEAKLELFLEAEKYEYALQELILIIEDFEPTVYHYIKTANCFQNLGKSDKARQILHFALEIYPDEEDLFFEIGLIEIGEEDYSLALEFILKAIDMNDQNEDFHTTIAFIYEYFGELYNAKSHLKESLCLDNINEENWLKLCLFSFDSGDYEDCLNIIEESRVHIYSNKIEVLEAAIHFKSNERSKAFSILNRVIEEDIDSINDIFRYVPSLENDIEINALLQVYQPI